MEELRLQRLRQREEALARPARDISQRRRDAEAARRVAEDMPERGEETWVEVATARGRRPRSPAGLLKVEERPRIRIETLPPLWVGR